MAAFALGYGASEYHHSLVHQTETCSQPLVQTQASVLGKASSMPSAEAAPSNDAALSAVKPDEKVGDVFSWLRVDQLIAKSKYEDAIHLLQTQMGDAKNAPRAWLYLSQIYKNQSQVVAAVDAWFRYLKLEMDDQKISKALADIKNYLVRLKDTPSLFNEDYAWLMGQFDELLKYNPNDGELHLILAALLLQLDDTYQAQYHALMAANDPHVQRKAEVILAQLNGSDTPQEINIPLTRQSNQFLVNVTVEGYPARLLLDTGASLSGLSASYTAKYPTLIKATKPIHLNTASGVQDSFLFTVTNISIENLVFNQHILAQLPMDNSHGFDGLLGVDILGRFDFVIDQNASVLRLKVRKQQ